MPGNRQFLEIAITHCQIAHIQGQCPLQTRTGWLTGSHYWPGLARQGNPNVPRDGLMWSSESWCNKMQDGYGRTIDYLRVALTDRCNLKCWYCVGRDHHQRLAPDEVLRHDEFVRLLRLAVNHLGITKIRLTGGEPLLYDRLEELVRVLRSLPLLRELTLTSNGLLLAEKAAMLYRAGLDRVNVSLEGASDEAYRRITGQACLDRVRSGLRAVLEAGFEKPKINIVLCRTFDLDELRRLFEIGRQFAHELRFIELMGHDGLDYPRVDDIANAAGRIAPLQPLPPRGTATQRYQVEGHDVVLGLIPSRTHPFCADCRRLRLASDGQLRTCLFTRQGVQLRLPLCNGLSDDELVKIMRNAVFNKPHYAAGADVRMCEVGG